MLKSEDGLWVESTHSRRIDEVYVGRCLDINMTSGGTAAHRKEALMATPGIKHRLAAISLASVCVLGVGVSAAGVASAAERPAAAVSSASSVLNADFDNAQIRFKNSTDHDLTIDMNIRDGGSFMRLTRTIGPGETTLPGLYGSLSSSGNPNDYVTATVHYDNGNTSQVQLVEAGSGQQLVDASDGSHSKSVKENGSDTMWVADNKTQGDDPTSFHKMSVDRAANFGSGKNVADFVITILQ